MDEPRVQDKWYLTLNYSETKDIIREKLQNMSRDFVAVGYYLKWIRDKELYKQDGYSSIWEFAEDNYGIKRTTASRWIAMNDKFSEGGNTPILAKEFRMFGKSQLQEMLYLEDNQLDQVTPDMTVKEIREVREPEPEEEPVSILGYPLRVYQEGSLLKTPGCGKQDCFSCHRDGCELRQEYCYCVEAPMGNPFPCTTLNVVENLREEVGNRCQFVNEDLAFHRAGDEQPVPCCKQCNHPCGYECIRSVRERHEVAKKNMCDVAHESEEQIPGQMNVEDYPELLPVEQEPDIDINNDEDNVVIERPEIVINQPESVIDTEYCEVNEDKPDRPDAMLTCLVEACMEELDFDKLSEESEDTEEFQDWVYDELFGMIVRFWFESREYKAEFLGDIGVENADTGEKIYQRYVWKQFFEELDRVGNIGEKYAAENAESCCQKAADLDELTFSETAIRDYLEEEEQTLAEYEKVNSEDGGLPLNLMMRQRMLVKALRLLMENEADQEEQEDDEPEEQEELEPVQPELPAMKNNDQRKEWLKNYKEWGLWYRDDRIDVNYYKYEFSDGSRLVVAEYPKRRMYWRPNEFADEHYYHLLDKNRKYYGSDKTFEQQYVHSTDSETSLVEFLKNLQKGEKK